MPQSGEIYWCDLFLMVIMLIFISYMKIFYV